MRARKLTKETICQIGVSDRGFPEFRAGDTVAVVLRIKEGEKERLQTFEGDVISVRGGGDASKTFTVRRIGAHGVAVERILTYYSPLISSIKVIKYGDVRRAKLFYVRDRVGKAARLKEKVRSRDDAKKPKAAAKATPVVETPAPEQESAA